MSSAMVVAEGSLSGIAGSSPVCEEGKGLGNPGDRRSVVGVVNLVGSSFRSVGAGDEGRAWMAASTLLVQRLSA